MADRERGELRGEKEAEVHDCDAVTRHSAQQSRGPGHRTTVITTMTVYSDPHLVIPSAYLMCSYDCRLLVPSYRKYSN